LLEKLRGKIICKYRYIQIYCLDILYWIHQLKSIENQIKNFL